MNVLCRFRSQAKHDGKGFSSSSNQTFITVWVLANSPSALLVNLCFCARKFLLNWKWHSTFKLWLSRGQRKNEKPDAEANNAKAISWLIRIFSISHCGGLWLGIVNRTGTYGFEAHGVELAWTRSKKREGIVWHVIHESLSLNQHQQTRLQRVLKGLANQRLMRSKVRSIHRTFT